MGPSKKVYIVIPTFNESENLVLLVTELYSLPLDGIHVLIVDDNSPDGTGEIAETLAGDHPGRLTVVHRSGKLGLGSAYITGFSTALKSGADFVVQMDADFSHPPEKIIEFVSQLTNFDVALGSRYVPGGSVDERWPVWRKTLSAFGNIYAKSILRMPVNDATGGFRAWRRNTLLGIPLQKIRSNGYAFQVEMAYLAHKLGYSMVEVPFYFSDRQWGGSKMSFSIQVEAAWRVWQMLFEYRQLEPVIHSTSDSLNM